MQGCRALLVDKDKNPKVEYHSFLTYHKPHHFSYKNLVLVWLEAVIDIRLVLQWEPSKLELISNQMVDKYFAKVDDEVWEDLKLPYRPTRTSRL